MLADQLLIRERRELRRGREPRPPRAAARAARHELVRGARDPKVDVIRVRRAVARLEQHALRAVHELVALAARTRVLDDQSLQPARDEEPLHVGPRRALRAGATRPRRRRVCAGSREVSHAVTGAGYWCRW